MDGNEFRERWLAQFGLSRGNWPAEARAHITKLPFIEPGVAAPLVRELFTNVPRLLEGASDPELATLAETYAWCCFALWQCESSFPAFPENYAEFLKGVLVDPGRWSTQVLLLARMIAVGQTAPGQCGFNRLALANPGIVRQSEERMLDGEYEVYLDAGEKYDEYCCYLRNSQAFQAEWRAVKTAFPRQARIKGILHRSLLPERNWERGPGARFIDSRSQFQAVFDLFCWKYYLWGMHGDEPLLMKTSVTFTPLGTQIFYPRLPEPRRQARPEFRRYQPLASGAWSAQTRWSVFRRPPASTPPEKESASSRSSSPTAGSQRRRALSVHRESTCTAAERRLQTDPTLLAAALKRHYEYIPRRSLVSSK